MLAFAFVFTACDVDPASSVSQVWITPSSAQIKKGQSVSFTAHGGYEYTWTLKDYAIGSLSSTRGATVIYTGLMDSSSSNTVQQVLTVVSYITGDSGTTNSSPAEWTATAYINHI